jgi:hypothetical protein
LVNHYQNGCLNLSPGFQRQSVWRTKDRQNLIDSIIRNYALPAIFLYKRTEKGKIIYDVIDGKQRLESILMFMGEIRGNRYDVRLQLPGNEAVEWINWKLLQKRGLQTLITGYRLYTIEVDGSFNNIIDLFVRINSTGKPLTGAEKQHAKFYNSQFLKTAAKLASKYESYFSQTGIISSGQISRMKHVELMCELLISIFQDDVINKKAAIDRVMEKDHLTIKQINSISQKTVRAINIVKKIFPKLNEVRFSQISDYYILVILFARYDCAGLILLDRKRNKLAWDILQSFSVGVDTVRQKQKNFQAPTEAEQMFRDYLSTVLQATDEVSQRQKRIRILDGLLRPLFEKKDINRSFSPEQRRLIWHSTKEKKCQVCKKTLTWDDFTIDHIDPYSRGGRTSLENAALLCRKHNSSKGNRTKR